MQHMQARILFKYDKFIMHFYVRSWIVLILNFLFNYISYFNASIYTCSPFLLNCISCSNQRSYYLSRFNFIFSDCLEFSSGYLFVMRFYS